MKQAIARRAQRDLLSEIFHVLSQPLTATQCSLELALECTDEPEERRSLLEAALENAERLRQQLGLLRELSDAEDPGDLSHPVELNAVFGKVMELVLGETPPIVGANGVSVVGDVERLQRAFCYVLETLLSADRPALAPVIQVTTTGHSPREVRVTISGAAIEESRLTKALSWEVARRTFEAIGGRLVLHRAKENAVVCEVVLQRYQGGWGEGGTVR